MRRVPFIAMWSIAVTSGALAGPPLAVTPDPARVAIERGLRIDESLGVPRMLWGAAVREPVATVGAAMMKASDVAAAGRRHLESLAPLYRLTAESLDAVEVRELRVAGSRLVRFGQRFEGIPVQDRELNLMLDASGGLVLATGNLSPAGPAARFERGAEGSFVQAWAAVAGPRSRAPELATIPDRADWTPVEVASAPPRGWRLGAGARVRKVWFLDRGALRPAHAFELPLRDEEDRPHAYQVTVDAVDGRVLEQRSVMSAAGHTYLMWHFNDVADPLPAPGPSGADGLPHPTGTPDGYLPQVVSRLPITMDATSFRPDQPWFATPLSNTMQGHQVQAFVDFTGSDDAGQGFVPAANGLGEFAFAWDETLDAVASEHQASATLVQAFYAVNYIADWFHPAGFDEAGGNHQVDNFGRGGLGNDPLTLQTADAGSPNNAYATVWADGMSPEISMGVYTSDREKRLAVTGDGGTALDLSGDDIGTADFGPPEFDLTDELVIARDDAGVDPYDLCEPVSNAAEVAGRVALVVRGNCFFADKTIAAQSAGAVGIVIHNHTPSGQPSGGVIYMAVSTPGPAIPALSLSLENGTLLRDRLVAGEALTVRLKRDQNASVDSAADIGIVTHEWGHVLVNRNVTTPFPGCGNTGASCFGPQPQGINEGTADFVSLLFLAPVRDMPSGFAFDGAYVHAYWANGRAFPNGSYFGSRRYPYSTNLAINPLTFGHLATSMALPAGVPRAYSGDPTEVHAVGEVWAAVLWDAYVNMLRSGRHPYATARERMRDHLVAALKVMPDAPTFLEARDVIYGVVLARDPGDHPAFTQAFAKRGMGRVAVGPRVDDLANGGIVESYLVEPSPAPPPPARGGGGESGGLALLVLAWAAARRARSRGR